MNPAETALPAGTEPDAHARRLEAVHRAWSGGASGAPDPTDASLSPRPLIAASWRRSLRRGLDPDLRPGPAEPVAAPTDLKCVLPVLRNSLGGLASSAGLAIVVCDPSARITDLFGDADLLRDLAAAGLGDGTRCDERRLGANALGLALAGDLAVQVFGAEHWLRVLHAWAGSAAPLTSADRDVIGAIALYGPAHTFHSAFLAAVELAAGLGQAHHRLARLARYGTLALQPTAPGSWTSHATAVTVDTTSSRLAIRAGDESWCVDLSPRHLQVLVCLAERREGWSAAALAEELFGDPERTVTVRAEFSRLRRRMGDLLATRPYRFADHLEVEVSY